MRIVKWELRVAAGTDLDLPVGWRLLDVAFQDEALYVWVLQADRSVETQRVMFHAAETGEFVPDGMEFGGSAQGLWRGRPYVAHVFYERIEVLSR